MSGWIVGVDLGGTKIALGLIDPSDRIRAQRRIPTRASEGAPAVVERIAHGVAELQSHLPHGELVGAVGICSPGPVDHVTGILIDPPNLAGLHHAPLRQMLSERLEVPVTLEHDAKAAALGEYHYGAGRGERSMVYVVVGTGVGAAIIIEGQLYRGLHNSAGEIGHTTLDPHGDPCPCGSRGCVETFAAGPWIARGYERALGQSVDRGSPEGRQTVTAELVARQAAQGDAVACQAMEDAGEALGIAVATMAMILDIDLFVVGSSVAKAGDLLLEPARRALPQHAYQSVSSRVRIVVTELGDAGPILGCGWLARQIV